MAASRKDRERYKQTIATSKASQEAEIRAITAKVAHRPVAEIVLIIRERTGIAPDPDFIRSIVAK